MISQDHKTKWAAFVAAHTDPDTLIDEEKIAMFRHGWRNPERNVDDYHEALFAWRNGKMRETG